MKHTLPRFGEFIVLMALLGSMTALSIDAMFPAMTAIKMDLHATQGNQIQLIVPSLFLGLGLGQLLFGPSSDAFGRKPPMLWGLGIFIAGSLLSMLAPNFSIMLMGRFLQGIGAAATRVVSMALIRDCYTGRGMARVMSFIMSVFILVPMLAPSLGQLILKLGNWRMIFAMFVVLALIAAFWFQTRMPETLSPQKRRPFTLTSLIQGLTVVLNTRSTLLYTLAIGLVFGAFMGYLGSSEAILKQQYQLGDRFPLYFALLALGVGTASLLNARLVQRFGMYKICLYAILGTTTLAVIYLVAWVGRYAEQPPLNSFMLYLFLSFLHIGLLFGNLNALAMEPVGHMAGLGASLIGAISTLISVGIGTMIGQAYNGTVLPVVLGFALIGFSVSLLLLLTPPPQHKA